MVKGVNKIVVSEPKSAVIMAKHGVKIIFFVMMDQDGILGIQELYSDPMAKLWPCTILWIRKPAMNDTLERQYGILQQLVRNGSMFGS